MRRVIISAPFGNYLKFPNTTPTLGTYTLRRRGGFFYRMWRILKTVRTDFKGSWVNKLGLPNPGIDSIKFIPEDAILSIHGFDKTEWSLLLEIADNIGAETVELNISCPNVKPVDALPPLTFPGRIIAKLSPVNYLDVGKTLYDQGVRYFHLCNTLPSGQGGHSGKLLKPHSLRAVEIFRKTFGTDVKLIGGGGITTLEDVNEYVRAGVNHVAIGTMLFNPLHWNRVKSFSQYLEPPYRLEKFWPGVFLKTRKIEFLSPWAAIFPGSPEKLCNKQRERAVIAYRGPVGWNYSLSFHSIIV